MVLIRKVHLRSFWTNLSWGKVEIWGDQSIIRDHIYIKDVLSAIEAAIKSPTIAGVYTIASGVGYSQYDEAKALNEVLVTINLS